MPRSLPVKGTREGCLSAVAFSATMTARWKELRERGAGQLTVLLVDLDGLHELNSEHGRDAGDRAIAAALAELARAGKRESWPLGRIGGDEFALLAASTSIESAFLRADAIRRDLDAALARSLARGQRCTVSVGVANIPRDARTPEELMKKADLALYAAKEQGGDAVGLTPGDDMILKSSYYSAAALGRLKGLAERTKKKEAVLLREALDDLLRKYDRQ